MDFDFNQLAPLARYELLLSVVAPRPIALVTTVNDAGMVNAAPYSLFNVICHDPPVLALSVLGHPAGRLKDTANNIISTREFVVSVVAETLAEQMNLSCIDAPPDIDETMLAKLKTVPAIKVRPPRLADSPVALECVLETTLSFAQHQLTVFGRIVHASVGDEFVQDPVKGTVDASRLGLIGAMHAAKWYARTNNLFAIDRPAWATWKPG